MYYLVYSVLKTEIREKKKKINDSLVAFLFSLSFLLVCPFFVLVFLLPL